MSVSSLHLPMAIATRPQFGSPPCTAVFTSGELTIALATRFAWATSRAASTWTSISEWAPSPSRAICLVRSTRNVVQRRLERHRIDRAGGTRGHDDRRVARGRVGVDAHAVERPVDHPSEGGIEIRRRQLGVGEQQRDVCRHVGLDHPDALGHSDHPGRRSGDLGLGELGDGVGGHHPACRPVGVVGGEVRGQCADARPDAFDRVTTPDDPRGGHDDVGRLAAEAFGHRAGHLDGVVVALPAGRDVRVLGDDHHGAGHPVGDVRPAQRDARPGEPALREHRGGRHRRRCCDHDEVVGVVLHADVGDVAPEAGGQAGHASNPCLPCTLLLPAPA